MMPKDISSTQSGAIALCLPEHQGEDQHEFEKAQKDSNQIREAGGP